MQGRTGQTWRSSFGYELVRHNFVQIYLRVSIFSSQLFSLLLCLTIISHFCFLFRSNLFGFSFTLYTILVYLLGWFRLVCGWLHDLTRFSFSVLNFYSTWCLPVVFVVILFPPLFNERKLSFDLVLASYWRHCEHFLSIEIEQENPGIECKWMEKPIPKNGHLSIHFKHFWKQTNSAR